MSYHLGNREIGVFDELLPGVGEPGSSGTVDHAVVAPVADVDHFSFAQLTLNVTRHSLEFSDRHDAHLGRQDQWAGVSATDSSDVRQTNCPSLQFFAGEFGVLREVSESLQFALDSSQVEGLNVFDVGDYEAVGGIDGDADIMTGVNFVLVGVDSRLVNRVHPGILLQRQGKSLDQNAHNRHLLVVGFKGFPHSLDLSDVKLFVEVEVRNGVAFSH